jgi:NADH-quinone oxidoreductase subunit H
LLKTYALIFVIMWVRWTLPRLRVDQLMLFSWKFLVPVALLHLMAYGLVLALWL